MNMMVRARFNFLLGFCIGAGFVDWLSVSKNEKKKRKERT
jgi:hypothetical protein